MLNGAGPRTNREPVPVCIAARELEQLSALCARITTARRRSEIGSALLEPLAGFLGAETASFRLLSGSEHAPQPTAIVTVGIPDAVNDAYLTRYFRLDPAKRLLQRPVVQPVLPDPSRDGEWADERATPTFLARHREEFSQYHREFLLPNHFVHHIGFCVRDVDGGLLLFDFHRPARSPAFGGLERARARTVSLFVHARTAQRLELAAHRDFPREQLSVRERAVAEAVARGLSNKEVAVSLGLSVRTIENHLRSIFVKIGVKTRGRLAAKLYSHRSLPHDQ
jgi:DNA-binding CsgD family transcriptional regulator